MRWIFLAFSFFLACTTRAHAQDAATEEYGLADDREQLVLALRVVTSAGVAGHFADPVCQGDTTLRAAGFARHARTLGSFGPEGRTPLVVDSGGLVQPHGVARYAASQDPEALAALVHALGYDVLAFSFRELEAKREPMLSIARALAARGVPYVLSNLRCDDATRALCELVRDADEEPFVLERGAERVAFLAYVDEASLHRVSSENVAGLTILPLAAQVAVDVRRAHAMGATLVVVSVDNGHSQTAIADALALAESLEPDAKPDLLIAARAGQNMRFTRPASFYPAVTAAPPSGVSTLDIRRSMETGFIDMRAQTPVESDAQSVAIDAFIARIGARYCADYGRELPGGSVERPLDTSGIFELANAAMREASGAEISLLHRGIIERDFAPMRASGLSASDVHIGIRHDQPIVVATVSADYLRTLARNVARSREAELLGLTITNPGALGESITVNGRPLEPRGRYRIATVRFLASGGDGLVPDGATFTTTEETLRGALLTHLERPRARDPRDDFSSPADRIAFAFTIQSDASFGGTYVDNTPGFDASQLATSSNLVFGSQNLLTLSARSTTFAWDSTLIARYRTTRAENGPREEGEDLISFRSNARYRGFRARLPKVYVPEPFGELYAESEFTVPDTRTYRHFLMRPTVGLQLTLTPQLGFRINGGFELEALAPDTRPSFGVGAQLLLTPWTFFTAGPRSGTLSFTADYFLSQLGGANRMELRGNLDLNVALSSFFGLAFTSTLFGLQTSDTDFALAFSTTASVRVGWYVRAQR